MGKLLLATNNLHKVREISDILGKNIEIFTLRDLGIKTDIEEDRDSLEGNAVKKASEIFNITKIPTLSDDTGLFVSALDGQPGVFSSRYAGENATYDDNCSKLLTELQNKPHNNMLAFFRTVICYYKSSSEYFLFEGLCKGIISTERRGNNGFGYDPLFIPDNTNKTYAELSEEEKNRISHRSRALINFRDYFKNYLQ